MLFSPSQTFLATNSPLARGSVLTSLDFIFSSSFSPKWIIWDKSNDGMKWRNGKRGKMWAQMNYFLTLPCSSCCLFSSTAIWSTTLCPRPVLSYPALPLKWKPWHHQVYFSILILYEPKVLSICDFVSPLRSRRIQEKLFHTLYVMPCSK